MLARALILVVACGAALLGIDTLGWRLAGSALQTGINRWAALQSAQGWRIDNDRPPCPCRVAGWPFAVRVYIDRPSAEGDARLLPGGLDWDADRIAVSVSLWHPSLLRIAITGQQHVRLSHAPTIIFDAAHMIATLPYWGGKPDRFDLHAQAIAGGLLGSGHPQDVQVESLRLSARELIRPDKEGLQARLAIEVRGIGLPDNGHWPLGGTIESLGGELALNAPPMPFWDAQPAGATPLPIGARAQAEAWHDGGGVLSLRDVELHWGALALRGGASLHLDARLQPVGSGTMDITGLDGALDALVAAGQLTPGLASTYKAVAATLAPAPPAALHLPFALRDNTLSVGEIPLVHLNDIVWQRERKT